VVARNQRRSKRALRAAAPAAGAITVGAAK
jgi:hypothetical protein